MCGLAQNSAYRLPWAFDLNIPPMTLSFKYISRNREVVDRRYSLARSVVAYDSEVRYLITLPYRPTLIWPNESANWLGKPSLDPMHVRAFTCYASNRSLSSEVVDPIWGGHS